MITIWQHNNGRKPLTFTSDINLFPLLWGSLVTVNLFIHHWKPDELVYRPIWFGIFSSITLLQVFYRGHVIFDEKECCFRITNTLFTCWRKTILWDQVEAIQFLPEKGNNGVRYSAFLKIRGKSSRRVLFYNKKLPQMQLAIEMAEIAKLPVEYQAGLYLPLEYQQRLDQLERI